MSNWISVEDRMPELEERVLLITQSGEIVTGWLRKLPQADTYFCFGNVFAGWDYDFNYDLGAVTHWQILPKPPK